MKIVQKITFIGSLIFASLYFLYSLSFSTGWALGGDGLLGDFFFHAQAVNQLLYKYGLIIVLFAGANLVFNSHSNHHFYIPNFLFAFGTIIAFVVTALATFREVPALKIEYMALSGFAEEEFGLLDLLTTINLSSISTRLFDLGILAGWALLVMALLLLISTIYMVVKKINYINENKFSARNSVENRYALNSNTVSDYRKSSEPLSNKKEE